MVAKPIPVTVHFRIPLGIFRFCLSKKFEMAQTLFIVNPGIATDAKSCHTNVSVVVKATFFKWFPSAVFFCEKKELI